MVTNDPTDILNWRRVDGRITLSGQPSADQIAALSASGIRAVINLAPADNDGALKNEAELVAAAGMGYRYIPVDFSAPSEADFAAFCAAMDDFADAPLHIHCIYNARVTAFMLRYAREGRGGDADDAAERMEGIWRPGGDWADFLGEPARKGTPNTFEGYEYSLADEDK